MADIHISLSARLAPALLFLLAGCSLGPLYRRPEVATPTAWRAPVGPALMAWPSRTWWHGFGSAELDELMEATATDNFDIQAAMARVKQADAAVKVAGATLLPTVNTSASESWQRSGSAKRSGSLAAYGLAGGGYSESRTYNLGLSVSYEVDLWGRVRATQQAAEATALASRYDQQTVALTALSSVATTWITALAYQDRLAVAERNLHDAEEILAAIHNREQVGTASMLDVAQQEAEVAVLRANVPALRSQLEQQVIALGILVGRPPEAVRVSKGSLDELTMPQVTPGLPAELLARRPDVASAEAGLIAANANVRAARAAFFPQISLTGSGGWESLALSTLTGPGSVIASATGSIAQTVFDNGSLAGTYEENKGRYEELVADYRKAVIQAFTDVENALTALRYATEQEDLERRAAATAQRASDIARAQLAAGTIDIVTALQTENTLFSALDTLVQVRLARLQALVNLYKALGGGWAQSDVPSPPSTIFHGVL